MYKRTWIAVAAVVAVAAGAAAVIATYPPATRLAVETWQGDRLREARQEIADPLATDHWRAASRGDKGVTVWDPISAERGFTLYTSGEGAVARLVTMTGAVMQEWSIPYSKLWAKEKAAVQEPQPDPLVSLRDARVMPNGDLIAVYEAAGHVPAGYGMVKVDKASKPIWSYLQRVHGTFDMAPDGRVFALAQTIRGEAKTPSLLEPPFIEDFLVVLSPDGKETVRLSLVDALERSRYASLLSGSPKPAKNAARRDDPLGATSVQYMGDDSVSGAPAGAGDRVLLSFGALGVVAIMDVARKEIVWAVKGPWKARQEARALPNGNLLVIDSPAPDTARAQEVNPAGNEVAWTYGGVEGQMFATASRLGAERLANGNTLLTEADGGRLIEVDKTGTVVWEYTNPIRAGQDGARIPVIAAGQRILAKDLDSSFRGFTRP